LSCFPANKTECYFNAYLLKVYPVKKVNRIQVESLELDRFLQLKKGFNLSETQVMKKLLDYFDRYQQDFKPLQHQLETYKQRELKALTIGDAISDGIYIIDNKGIVLEVNKRFCQLVDMDQHQLIGKPIQQLKDKGISNQIIGLKVLKKGSKLTDMITILNTNKKVLVTGNPFYNDEGHIVQVLVVVRDITELIRLKEELEAAEKAKNHYLKELDMIRSGKLQSQIIIGQSASLIKIKELITQISQVGSTVLITGETGVGKEVIARRIFEKSKRNKAPYIRINCAAMPESLIESELFGYEKGAFTGARSQGKPGMFELANNGTILLDEIGDMPLNLQPKLLRVLQEREITRIGDTKQIKLDVRVLATTNQNLAEQVKTGKFRKDLFYRINVIPIYIPPLKERKEDIPFLVKHFLSQFNARNDRQTTISSQVMELMQTYHYPGNVRELKNIVERLVVTGTSGIITPADFFRVIGLSQQEPIEFDPSKMNLKETVSHFEGNIIQKAVELHGSTYKAAKALGISQPSVVRKRNAHFRKNKAIQK
jgi:PAS domain S-box-containing protein